MSFWEGEDCEYCDGRIVEKRVDLHRILWSTDKDDTK